MTNTVYQILTGVLPSTGAGDEQGESAGGQGLAGGVADMAVLQNLAHRPKDQIEEALALICELLPPTPRDGVFDPKAYTEKSLAKYKKGRTSEKAEKPSTRRSSRHIPAVGDGVTGTGGDPSTPAAGPVTLPAGDSDVTPSAGAGPSAAVREAMLKAKKDADAQMEQRMELLKAQPELVGKYIKAIVPVLVDVYAASVALRVRTKVLNGLVKAVAFAEEADLRATLKVCDMTFEDGSRS
jgi:E3 ubiquitin-protein ligase TRIP12